MFAILEERFVFSFPIHHPSSPLSLSFPADPPLRSRSTNRDYVIQEDFMKVSFPLLYSPFLSRQGGEERREWKRRDLLPPPFFSFRSLLCFLDAAA